MLLLRILAGLAIGVIAIGLALCTYICGFRRGVAAAFVVAYLLEHDGEADEAEVVEWARERIKRLLQDDDKGRGGRVA